MTEIKTTAIPRRQRCIDKEHPYIGGAKDIYDDNFNIDQQRINSIVFDDAVKVTLTATPSPVFVSEQKVITVSATVTANCDSIVIKKGDTVLQSGTDIASLSCQDTITPDAAGNTGYLAEFKIGDLVKTATRNVTAVNKIYYGIGTSDDYSEITAYQSARTSPSSATGVSYPFTPTAEKEYVYILVPYAMGAINLANVKLSSGFGYNMELITDNYTKDNARYRVYRSVAPNQAVSFIVVLFN